MSLQKVRGIVELYLYEEIQYNECNIKYIVMKKYKKNICNYRVKTQEELIIFVKDLLSIINNVHKKGIIHRDIKPENIFFDENDSIVLADFGIAYYNPEFYDYTGNTIVGKEILGNKKFSAPEQMEKDAVPNVTMDIFAVGQIIQYIATGKQHTGTHKVHIGKGLEGNKINEINNIIDKCLDGNPNSRYQSIQEILDLNVFKDIEEEKNNKKTEQLITNINKQQVYEYICLNQYPTTREIAEEFNYDIGKLKTELKKMWKVESIIKMIYVDDNPEDDNCHWTKNT